MNHFRPTLLTLALALLAACAGPGAGPSPSPSSAATLAPTAAPTAGTTAGTTVRLLTHDSFAISDETLAEFTRQTGLTVEVLRAGDAGTVVNQAILTRAAPLADVLYGVDNSFLSRALDEGIFEPYQPEAAADLPAELQLDAQGRVTAIDYGDVCVNYDKDAFADGPPPATLQQLADPAHSSRLVVENPATSSPGLAFMLATIARFGESGDYTWLDYWADLRANDVLVVSDWNDAYYGQFSGGSGEGDRPLVVSYATSPAAEVVFADPPTDVAPTGVIDDGCFRQVELAGVLTGATNPSGGQQLIDFMLSPDFQADIPLNMFVFPARPDVELPDAFAQHAVAIAQPLTLDPALIAANRERWLQEWTDVVLH